MNTKQKWYAKSSSIIVFIIAGIIAITAVSFVHTNNSLITQKQAIETQSGQIQIVIQRQADLIPNLVSAVKGQQKQEKSVYKNIADARTEYYNYKNSYNNANSDNAKLAAMENQSRALNVMVGSIKEAYPKLDSNKQMSDLMVELEGSVNRISVERLKYNTLVESYNTTVLKFPSSIVASMTTNNQINYFKSDNSAQKTPNVKF